MSVEMFSLLLLLIILLSLLVVNWSGMTNPNVVIHYEATGSGKILIKQQLGDMPHLTQYLLPQAQIRLNPCLFVYYCAFYIHFVQDGQSKGSLGL